MYIFSDESNLSAHETSLRNTFRKRPAAPLHSFSTPTSPTVINRSPFCPPVTLIALPTPKLRPFQRVNSHQQNVFAPPHPFHLIQGNGIKNSRQVMNTCRESAKTTLRSFRTSRHVRNTSRHYRHSAKQRLGINRLTSFSGGKIPGRTLDI